MTFPTSSYFSNRENRFAAASFKSPDKLKLGSPNSGPNPMKISPSYGFNTFILNGTFGE